MAEPLYIESLYYLSSFGIGYKVDLKPTISGRIKGKVNTPIWIESVNNSLNVLKCMKKYKHIDYSEGQDLMALLVSDGKYLVEITANGFEYIDKLRSNKSIRSTNNVTKYVLILTIFFSVATGIITLLNYKLSKDNYGLSLATSKSDSLNSIKTESRLDTLSTLLSKLQSTLSAPKAKKTYPLQKHPLHQPSD